MVQALLAILAAIATEVIMQLVEQDKKRMRELKEAEALRAQLIKDHDAANAKCSKLDDQLKAIDKKLDNIFPNVYDEHSKIYQQEMEKWRKIQAERKIVSDRSHALVMELIKAQGNIKRIRDIKIQISKLVPRVTSLLGKIAGVLSSLVTAYQLLEYAKEKLDQIKREREEIRKRIDAEKGQCSAKAPTAQSLNIISNAINSI